MEPQTNKGLVVGVIVIIVLAVAAGVYYSWPKTTPTVAPSTGTTEQEAIDTATQSILVTHVYVDGEHIYTGTIQVPTPCHGVTSEVQILESFPEKVRIALNTATPAEGSICAQVITDKPFTVRYKASETTLAENGQITLDGRSVLFILGGKD